ncbi:MAG TPA: ADP-ribosylglycohydrolase family protein, partial [Bacteroidales bacterium]|nr:ADP-ribosylglycohydrolase family protein [Bacteroidales bacterium]
MKRHYIIFSILLTFGLFANSCKSNKTKPDTLANPEFNYVAIKPDSAMHTISRTKYYEQLQGFWLGQCIANWTGLVTEMDKIGNAGEIQTGDFYTRNDWGKPDQPSIWGQGVPSDLSSTIDFVFADKDEIWGADDDTDIEYIYQHLLYTNETTILTAEQIREGWLKHIYSQKEETPFGKDPDGNYENFLWVSNQRAYNLMEEKGLLPPATGKPENNEHYNMIDAQLTTEIFGLFAPARPDLALRMAFLPIRTTADGNAAWISEFYVAMHALASVKSDEIPRKERIMWMANEARNQLPGESYAAKMYDFVLSRFNAGVSWEQARDEIYQRYQIEQKDGYDLTSRNLYCNGCFAAGINYASSLVSLFWGEGDIKETIKIAVLAGWDADNPAATWGGLLGFMIGKNGVEEAFGR